MYSYLHLELSLSHHLQLVWCSQTPDAQRGVWPVSHTVLVKLRLQLQHQSNHRILFNSRDVLDYGFALQCSSDYGISVKSFLFINQKLGVSGTKETTDGDNSRVFTQKGCIWCDPHVLVGEITSYVSKLITSQPHKWCMRNKPDPRATRRGSGQTNLQLQTCQSEETVAPYSYSLNIYTTA